ncbi:MAG: sugar phosphate isomerase/epimerase [Verrucomicrobia bacterium]|nr:sugar phosphate isomerase/epimerase [Verrucomicrobiota bacterium]
MPLTHRNADPRQASSPHQVPASAGWARNAGGPHTRATDLPVDLSAGRKTGGPSADRVETRDAGRAELGRYSRREAFGLGALALAGGLMGQVQASSPHNLRWRTAVGLNGFESAARKYRKSFPLWEILDFAARQGFDGVELVQGWPMGNYPGAEQRERIAALRRLYAGYGLQVFSIQLGADGAFDPDEAKRRRWVEEMRDRAAFAKQVGCSCLGLWPHGGLRGQSVEQAIDRLAQSFHQVGQIAADLGLVAAFEIEPPFVFNTEEHLRRIHAQADHPALKLIYDPSHFDLMNGSTGRPHEMLARVGVQNIGYVHLTDTDGTLRDGGTSKHLSCGDGHAQIPESLRVLRGGGFRGWIMIDGWEVPDPYEACVKGKEMIDAAAR